MENNLKGKLKMTTYTWTITNISCLDPDMDGDCATIVSASWNLSGNNGTDIVTINGITPLNLSMLDSEDPEALFSTLTEATVITAVQTAIGTNQVNAYHDTIDYMLTPKPTPVSAPLPWVV
jgi:hypothetical protein